MTTPYSIPLQQTSQEIWDKKYNLRDEHGNSVDIDVDGNYERVSSALADIEKPEVRHLWKEKFKWALQNGATPAGRIMSNAGATKYKPATSLINCTVSQIIKDSMHGVLDSTMQSGLTLKAGCGIGYEFSTLRPKGAFVSGAGASTSGPLTFMDIFDATCFTVSSAGGRRGAQMGTFAVWHPDVVDFIKAKRQNGRLRQFNLSLLIDDEFMEAVKADGEYKLVFPVTQKNIDRGLVKNELVKKARFWEKEYCKSEGYIVDAEDNILCEVYETVKASELWNTIMESTYDFSEPGFLLIDRINKYNNNWYCEEIRATNPCLTGDTLVLTKEGHIPIIDLVGKSVDIWNGFEWSNVTPSITGENQQIIDLEFSEGSKLSCTPYHKFILHDGRRVEAKELQADMKLAKFDYPVIATGVGALPKFAYTQGFYSGDGQTGTNSIWLYEGKCELAKFMNLSACSDQSNSSRNRRMMASIAHTVRPKNFVPDTKFDIPYRLDWLAGVMDSDGSVCNDGSVQIWSCDRDFLQSLKFMLQTVGSTGSISLGSIAGTKEMPDGKGGSAEYDVRDCWRISISASNVCVLRQLGLTTNRLDISHTPQRNAARFIKVKSATRRASLEDKVYCFTEEKRHSGVFNGVMTAQCGEQPLPPEGSCLLGSINVAMFVLDPFTPEARFDWDRYEEVVSIFTRMLDNVVEINGLPLEGQRREIVRKRRHGMGILGVGSALSLLGETYGNEFSIKFAGDLMKVMAVEGFRTGIALAEEKGCAPIFNEETDGVSNKVLWCDGAYMARIWEVAPHLHDLALIHGCRFTHHTSIAPTGTISLSLNNNASNGIEPTFAHKYTRNVIVEGKKSKQAVDVYSYEMLLYKHITGEDEVPALFSTTDSVSTYAHVDIQAAAQVWCDSSISKTINVPSDIPFSEFKDIYMYAYDNGLKGCTTFRFNPAAFQGVLVKEEDLEATNYVFKLDDGTEVLAKGNDIITYEGEEHSASNLYDALKEGYYGKF